jgi:hypothetical protein
MTLAHSTARRAGAVCLAVSCWLGVTVGVGVGLTLATAEPTPGAADGRERPRPAGDQANKGGRDRPTPTTPRRPPSPPEMQLPPELRGESSKRRPTADDAPTADRQPAQRSPAAISSDGGTGDTIPATAPDMSGMPPAAEATSPPPAPVRSHPPVSPSGRRIDAVLGTALGRNALSASSLRYFSPNVEFLLRSAAPGVVGLAFCAGAGVWFGRRQAHAGHALSAPDVARFS